MKYLGVALMILFFFGINGASGQGKPFTAKINKEGVQVIEMTANDYYYAPRIITVKVNVPVEIQIIRKSKYVQHNIIIEAPDAGINVYDEATSELKVIKFTPTKTGKYFFYCDRKSFFISHRWRGMEGLLKVVE